ncbi:FkbM family methyltransferase [Pedobacter sp. UYP30]|uniref:FkbM family methyltransferase n=1 Tax=Pedobacter sp. UYP30 TaxID=1756400 RepID=UPI003398A932
MEAFKRTFGFINQHPLASKHLLKSYFKFFTWQVKCRINKELQPIKFVDQTYFLAKKSLTGVTGNIYTGLHEFHDMGFLLHFLRPKDVFFDVGANVGAYTLLASGICKSKSISFEPVPSTFDILLKNIELNNLQNLVKLENKGVGKEHGLLKFSSDEDTTNHIIAENEDHHHFIQVPIVSLNDYFPNVKPALIKIDVEGFETEVLNGAHEILKDLNLKAIIIELNGSSGRYGYDETLIHDKLIELSFIPYHYDPFKRSLTALDTFGIFNTIYIRDLEYVENRVKNAEPFEVFNQKI